MSIRKRLFCAAAALFVSAVVCGPLRAEELPAEELNVAYQYGMAYAPMMIMEEKGLIEENYEGEVTVNWTNLNSGSAINEGVISGAIDVANMGVPPFLTGVMAGIPYKLYSTLSAQPHRLMSNREEIQSVQDITPEHKIALVNLGSMQHILLGMAAQKALGDAKALDNNIVAMSHPDGMTALLAGSVDCQVTTSPYIYQEMEQEGIHEVEGLSDVWPDGQAFIVALASNDLTENHPELYQAVVRATKQAQEFLNEQPEEAAEILAAKMDTDPETVLYWMQQTGCVYDAHLDGIMDMAAFMQEQGFLEKAPESLEEITTEEAR